MKNTNWENIEIHPFSEDLQLWQILGIEQ